MVYRQNAFRRSLGYSSEVQHKQNKLINQLIDRSSNKSTKLTTTVNVTKHAVYLAPISHLPKSAAYSIRSTFGNQKVCRTESAEAERIVNTDDEGSMH